MCIDRGISSSTGKIFAFFVGDMLAIFLKVALGKTKINQKYFIGSFVMPNTKIIWFDVTMDEMTVMNVLNSGNHLIDEHQYGFEREFPQRLIEE